MDFRSELLAFFDLQVTPMLPAKFRINWPFGSGEEMKNGFSRKPPWRPSWISDRNDFSHPDASYQVSSQLAFWFRRRSEISRFSRCRHGGHLRFLIRTIKALFDLQVTPMIPTKFQIKWSFGSGEEAKNRFSRWPPWRPSWISDRNDFTCFLSMSIYAISHTVRWNLTEFSPPGRRFP